MSISVVVPTLLTGPEVAAPLQSVVRAARVVDNAEVLVVANGPGPFWRPEVLAEPGVRLLHSPEQGAAAARNYGMAAASHRHVLFTDDDCVAPPDWCRRMLDRLADGRAATVAAPAGVEVAGPVTAFLDYQRVFDAPPLDRTTARYLVTGNCAIDRDRTSVSFNAEVFQAAGGEDSEFGYRVRDTGEVIDWFGDGPRVMQRLPDELVEITERFVRYGVASALLGHRLDRQDESMPGALGWYEDIVAGDFAGRRRFLEFADPRVRSMFATLELIMTATWLLGYLSELGRVLDFDLVTPDHRGLDAAWRGLEERLRAGAQGVDWTDLRPEPGRFWEPDRRPATEHTAELARIISQYAPIRPGPLPPEIRREIERDEDRFQARLAVNRQHARRLAAAFQPDGTLDELAEELRAVGQPFREGMHDFEEAVTDATATCPAGRPPPAR